MPRLLKKKQRNQKVYLITSIDELGLCLSRGINPLFFNQIIKLDIHIRLETQEKLFGKVITQANDKYYHYCWAHSIYHCENCGKKLYANRNIEGLFSAVYISHILSRGHAPEMAHDPRNHNILCPDCHAKWEYGAKEDMLIYCDNQIVIKELMSDYEIFAKFSYI